MDPKTIEVIAKYWPIVAIANVAFSLLFSLFQWMLNQKLRTLKDEILVAINGKYLHSDVAAVRFQGIEEKLGILVEQGTAKRRASRGR